MQQQGRLQIWVTGASGFVGRSLVRAAAAAGHSVVATTFDPPPPSSQNLEWVQADIRRAGELHTLFRERDIDVLIHAAARTNGTTKEIRETNVLGTENVVRTAMTSRVKRIVFLSSGAVYGATDPERAVAEHRRALGEGAYAASKIEGEVLSRRLAAHAGIGLVSCRLGTLYGPGEIETEHRCRLSIPSRIAKLAKRSVPAKVYGLSRRRPYAHVDDAATAILALARAPNLHHDTFNVDGNELLSLAELLAAARTRWPAFRFVTSTSASGVDLALAATDERSRLDTSRLEAAVEPTGWRSMEEGLRSFP